MRNYYTNDSELKRVKENKYNSKYDKFVIYDSNSRGMHLIGYYRMLQKTEDIPNIMERSHQVIKKHLNYRVTTEYIQDTLNWYWSNIYLDWQEYVSMCIKCRMHFIPKNKRIVSYIRTKRPYERYQVDLVELNMKGKFKYLCTWVYHFSKYAWAIPIRNKEAITVRNAIVHVFISGYPEMLQTDNVKEFTNSKLKSYLEGISVDHIFGAPYHPQS